MKSLRLLLPIAFALPLIAAELPVSEQWQTLSGKEGPGLGHRVVLISGDEEYRSEEALPQLAKILSERHGFECVVLFAQDPAAPGIVNPNFLKNIPGLDALEGADLMIIATRFRDLPDDQMRKFEAYLKSGRPVIGMRTATHAFKIPKKSPWAHWSFDYNGDQTEWHGGFGQFILGTSWVSHHGWHKKESTRGLITEANPITNGIESGSIWSPSDVYTVNQPLAEGTVPVVWGQVLSGMNREDPPIGPGPYKYAPPKAKGNAAFDKNSPMMPIAWTKPYQIPGGKVGKVFTTTLGASTDLADASTRRLLVNATYWCTGLPIPAGGADAALVGDYQPEMFGTHDETYWKNKALPVSLAAAPAAPTKGERIALIGNGLGEGMLYQPEFETEIQQRFPAAEVIVRNLCFPGDTPGFRPRAGRKSQWAFPGAEKFNLNLTTHLGEGHYPSPDEWLTTVRADTILALFGFNESFGGSSRLADYEGELDAFVKHTLAQKYNGSSAPRLMLVSPIAFENLSVTKDLPDGVNENKNLAAYADVMKRVAENNRVGFIDLFHPSLKRYAESKTSLTINGFSLNENGYRWLGTQLADATYAPATKPSTASRDTIYQEVADKDWLWHNDYGILNGVHVFGRRYKPFGDANYPEELEKIRQMTALRDKAIHRIANGETQSPEVDDSSTRKLSEVKTNFNRPIEFLDVKKALEHFNLPDGYAIDLFASEMEFPDLRNPVQMSFDNKGRLWVAVAPSYPHYRPGDERPNDKLLIFEDTDGDGRADKQTIFADHLHLPMGFEFAPEGVYLAQEPNLVLLRDDDHDDHADSKEIILHGFDTHDTHHAISAFSADASGAFYMAEGRFLHSQVETPYGPQRCTDGGVWRFDPKSWRLERFMQTDVSNPWGIAFDQWGQEFLADASGGSNLWSLPLSVKIPHGQEIPQAGEFTTQRVRPTAGAEFVSSRNFPDEVQGDFLLNNTIGFLGTKQHSIVDDGAGFTGKWRQDLVASSDPNFRPCDLEFAPDGSLYLIDWHNPLIGHMQHSARDPNRDHDHGRVYRVTYPSRPLVEPARIAGASVADLLEILKAPEYRTRYRARRELRGHSAAEVLPAVKAWVSTLDAKDADYDRNLLEALWATWAQDQVDPEILRSGLASPRLEVRAAAVNVLRYAYANVPDSTELLMKAAGDSAERVRLTAVVAASWIGGEAGARIALAGMQAAISEWSGYAYDTTFQTLRNDIKSLQDSGKLDPETAAFAESLMTKKVDLAAASKKNSKKAKVPITNMSAPVAAAYTRGQEVYNRDAHCTTCHGEDGLGAVVGVYPPLADSEWVDADDDLLVKIILKGLWGKIEVNGKTFDPSTGIPPMTAFEFMLDDQEVADVATYVRVAFRDKKIVTDLITPEQVHDLRTAIKDKTGFYTPEELLKDHPLDRK